jgi:indolepyruvate ferredoxin oxidoreductase beta subunit
MNRRCSRQTRADPVAAETKLIVAGIGGQGVVYATKVLSQAGLLRGDRVMASENHGMSQRGGSVMSHVRIGGSDAPLIRKGTADSLIALERLEAMRNVGYVRAGGAVFVNGTTPLDPSVAARLGELGIGVHVVDADARAAAVGSITVANLVMLGYAAAHPSFGFSLGEVAAAVRALGPAAAVERNLCALESGANAARQRPTST